MIKKLLAVLVIMCMISTVAVAAEDKTSIPATDENIRYIGRWMENEKGNMEGSWECQAVIRFTGTSIQLKGATGHIRTSIDGAPYETKLKYSDLNEGEHILRIVAGAQQAFPTLKTILIDEGAKLLPTEDKLTIEFVGDSILEGYVVGNNSVLNSYGHLIGEEMDVYRNIVAFGGITVTPNYGNPDKQGMINRYNMIKEYTQTAPVSDAWDHSQFRPDVIVVNLGTNDGAVDSSNFRMNYMVLMTTLRAAQPDAKIVFMTPFNGRHAEDIVGAVELTKDDNMYLVKSHLWGVNGGTDNTHPDNDGHAHAARELKAALEEILAPKATETPTGTPGGSSTSTPDNGGAATSTPDNGGAADATPTASGSDTSAKGNNDFLVGGLIGGGAAVVCALGAVIVAASQKKKKQ